MPASRESKGGAVHGARVSGESEGGGARGMSVSRESEGGAVHSARVSGESEGGVGRLM